MGSGGEHWYKTTNATKFCGCFKTQPELVQPCMITHCMNFGGYCIPDVNGVRRRGHPEKVTKDENKDMCKRRRVCTTQKNKDKQNNTNRTKTIDGRKDEADACGNVW